MAQNSTRPYHSFPTAIIAAVLTMLAPALVGAQEEEGCGIYVTFYNTTRRVPGPVNGECGWTIHNYSSNPPGFGNWGVESNRGGRYAGRRCKPQ